MKKLITLLTCGVVLAVSFTGCGKKVRDLGKAQGIKMGVAVTAGDIYEPNAMAYLEENCSILTYENGMKWANLRPNRKFWNWNDIDKLIEYCNKNKMAVKWHTLFWHQQNSSFVNNLKTKEEALELMDEHIDTIMTKYKGKIAEYDVVNEMFEEDGTWRDTIWCRLIGPEYIEHALIRASKADPDAILFLNDYNNEAMGNPKADAMFEYVKSLKERNIPIGGVGFQLHMDTRYPYDEDAIRANIRRYAEIGVDVAFTEVDVRLPVATREAHLEKQKEIYASLMKLAVEEPNVKTFITWGWTDAHTWVGATFPGTGEALLYDAEAKPKEVYNAVVEQLKK